MGDFAARIDELKELVGDGTCVGEVERDQVYAHYQEARLDLRHPNGGGPMYQEGTLYQKASEYLETIAGTVLDAGPNQGMIDAMEQFAGDSGEACPKELDLLARSDHPTVTSNGAVVYDRAPEVGRLSKEELKALAKLRPGHQSDLVRGHGLKLWSRPGGNSGGLGPGAQHGAANRPPGSGLR
jgi:hypothetical protein